MATTVILKPSSNISANHSSSSNNRSQYTMIYDVPDDSGSTNIYQDLSGSQSTKTSQFGCSADTNAKPTGKIIVRNIYMETYWNLYGNNYVSSINGTLTPAVSFENSEYISGQSEQKTASSNNYTLLTTQFNNLSIVNKIFNSIDNLNAKIQLTTTGNYTSD